MSHTQQIVVTKGRYQVVTTDGEARDGADADRARYAVTTLSGAVVHRDLTFDEARMWLDRLFAGDTVKPVEPEAVTPTGTSVRRAVRARH